MAADKGLSASQLAIAWIVAKGRVPIPGTKRVKYVEENIEAATVKLSKDEIDALESIVPLGTETGARYDANSMAAIDR